MRLKLVALVVAFIAFNCTSQVPTTFSEKALNDTFITLEGESIPFKQILEEHKGKTILIDVWASWCKDCITGLPKVKELQETNQEIAFVFLSLDKSIPKWKNGIEKYQLEGNHYFMQSGWKGDFGKFLKLNWIPRYLVVDANQNISVYKEIEVNTNLKNNLP